MDAETWMNANKAMELGFADGVIAKESSEPSEGEISVSDAVMFSRKAVNNAFVNKVTAKYGKAKETVVQQSEIPAPENNGHSVEKIMERLDTIKKFM